MLPLGKVDGGDNPVDQMTNNVGIEFANKHMKAIGIRFAEGRSGAAAKLHGIAEKDGWEVEQRGTYLNILKTHKVPRAELYTLEGEEEYPVHSSNFEAIRITSGKTTSGNVFEIEDNWWRHGRERRQHGEAWTGTITFAVYQSRHPIFYY